MCNVAFDVKCVNPSYFIPRFRKIRHNSVHVFMALSLLTNRQEIIIIVFVPCT